MSNHFALWWMLINKVKKIYLHALNNLAMAKFKTGRGKTVSDHNRVKIRLGEFKAPFSKLREFIQTYRKFWQLQNTLLKKKVLHHLSLVLYSYILQTA